MPKYHYKTVDKDNGVHAGVVSALTKAHARAKIRKGGHTVLFVVPEKNSYLMKEFSISRRFSKMERIIFFRNLAAMIASGLVMTSSLEVLEEQAKKGGVKGMIREMQDDIRNGKRLSDAMRKHPGQFSEYLVETIAVGEISGKLSETVDRLASNLEYDYELTRKVQGALAYPIIVVFVVFGALGVIAVFVLPKIADLYKELNLPLPVITATILGASAFLTRHPLVLAAGFIALVAALIFIWKNKKGKHLIHVLFLKVPVFGEMIKELNLAKFFRSLESLMGSGLSLAKSADVSKKVLGNIAYRKAIDEVYPVLIYGSQLSEALRPFPKLFPSQARKMIEVGEKTGRLEDIFLRISGYYDRSVRHKTQILTSLIEPILIVLIGAVVGGIAISVFVPIYQLSNAF